MTGGCSTRPASVRLHVATAVLVACLATIGNGGWSRSGEVEGMQLSQQTIEELRLFDRQLIAVVQCERVRFVDGGTRSERVVIETTAQAVGVGEPRSTYTLTRYTQGDSLMTPGERYLVAAYDKGEWGDAWYLVEWLPLAGRDAASVAREAAHALQP